MSRPIYAMLFIASATPSLALTPLHENATVVSRFYSIGLADAVRKNCDEIDARMFRAYRYLKSIESYAREAGYSDAEIDEFVDNKAEKNKLKARIARDLANRGATAKTPEGYCTVGREEIAKGSAAGRLLRAK